MVLLKVKALGLLALARALLLWLALELLESLIHESYCSVRIDRPFLVDRTRVSLLVLDIFMRLSFQCLCVWQIRLDVFDHIDDVDKVADCDIFLLVVGIVTPQDLLTVLPLSLVHELVVGEYDRMGISMNDQWFLCLFATELLESIWFGAADGLFVGQAGFGPRLGRGCRFRGLSTGCGGLGCTQVLGAGYILRCCN